VTPFVATTVSALVALAVTIPAAAQGKGKGNGNGHQSKPPSSSPLPTSQAIAGAVPFAWIDDASVLPPGSAALTVMALRWQGTDVGEVDAPVLGLAAGLAPRLQIGATIPRVVGNDTSGVVGGLGTTYVSAKFGVLTGQQPSGIKLAVAPTLQILGEGALQALAPDQSRTQFGLPVSMEVDRGAVRVFASTGFFTRGVWFAGGGVGARATPRVAVSAAVSRAWASSATDPLAGDRREVSGSVAFQASPQMSLFGSVGRTVATSDQDGAGTTLTGGVMFLLSAPVLK
jgi:hypothetical protein